MPHVAFVPFTGIRVREEEMLELGMTLPGLHDQLEAIAALPALGLLTLAGMSGTALYRRLHEAGRILEDRDWSHYTLFDVTYHPDRLMVDELERAFVEVVRRVFRTEEAERRTAVRREIYRCRQGPSHETLDHSTIPDR